MSTVKTKNVQVGTDGTASNNFTIYVPGTPDGTVRIGNGDAGAVTDVVTINSSGAVTLANNLTVTGTTTNTGAITSTGGIYLGGTAAANLLDNYEEGTWTPTISPTTSGSVSLSTALGTYTKVGNMVFLEAYIQASSISSPNGYFQITGLPFSSRSTPAMRRAGSIVFFNSVSANVADFMIYLNDGVNVMTCVLGDGTTQQLDSANQITATTIIRMAMSYTTD